MSTSADDRTAALESRIAALEQMLLDSTAGQVTETRPPVSRRGLLRLGAAGAVTAAGIGVVAARPETAAAAGVALTSDQNFDAAPVAAPPLNSSVTWRRRLTSGPTPTDQTRVVQSVIFEFTASYGYPWARYTDLKTSHNTGDGVGSYISAQSSGTGWMAARHADLKAQGAGTAIGENIEVIKTNSAARAIGVNILNQGGSGHLQANQAINVLAGSSSQTWETGLNFEDIGGSPISGNVAISIRSKWNIGLEMGPNDIRMQQGRRLYLDQYGQNYITCTSGGTIQIVKGSTVVASW